MSRSKLEAIVGSNESLVNVPVIANMDFGHTDPMRTLPVGGSAMIDASAGAARIRIRH